MVNKTHNRAKLRGIARQIVRQRASLAADWFDLQFSQQVHSRFPNPYAESADRQVVEGRFIVPLLGLLAAYANTGDDLCRRIYLSEWRRYAPHRDGPEVLTEYFRAVIPPLLDCIAGTIHGSNLDSASWLQQVHSPLLEPPPSGAFRLLTVGDCLLSDIQTFLRLPAREAGLEMDFRYYYFSAVTGANIEADGIAGAITSGVDAIAASYLSYQGIPLYRSLLESADGSKPADMDALIRGIVGFMSDHIGQMRASTNVPLLLHNACGLPLSRARRVLPFLSPLSPARALAVSKLNVEVARLSADVENCILVDETAVTSAHGLRYCGTDVLRGAEFRDADFHPAHFGRLLVDPYVEILGDLAFLKHTKLILVDFDNTLWKGVMADGPVEHDVRRQELLKRLSEEGILLASLSKNDPRHIRWDEMVLKPEDFAAHKINWNLKAQSIRELGDELNLGLDSFVMLDDNPAERALVAEELPKVRFLDSTIDRSWSTLERLFAMPNTSRTEEATARLKMYREQAERSAVVSTQSDYPALMKTLELRAKIGPARSGDIERVTELVQRTNQFNTTTIRYTRGEVGKLVEGPDGAVIVGELSDRFGNLGVVGLVIVRPSDDAVVVDSFVMSCRAMGFGFEHSLLARALMPYEDRRIVARFIPTDRNEPAAGFFSAAGFTEVQPGIWEKPANQSIPIPLWVSVVAR